MQNEKGDTAEDEAITHAAPKPQNRMEKPYKPENPAHSSYFGWFSSLGAGNRQFRLLLAKPVWKPRGDEETEDMTDFHLIAF